VSVQPVTSSWRPGASGNEITAILLQIEVRRVTEGENPSVEVFAREGSYTPTIRHCKVQRFDIPIYYYYGIWSAHPFSDINGIRVVKCSGNWANRWYIFPI